MTFNYFMNFALASFIIIIIIIDNYYHELIIMCGDAHKNCIALLQVSYLLIYLTLFALIQWHFMNEDTNELNEVNVFHCLNVSIVTIITYVRHICLFEDKKIEPPRYVNREKFFLKLHVYSTKFKLFLSKFHV